MTLKEESSFVLRGIFGRSPPDFVREGTTLAEADFVRDGTTLAEGVGIALAFVLYREPKSRELPIALVLAMLTVAWEETKDSVKDERDSSSSSKNSSPSEESSSEEVKALTTLTALSMALEHVVFRLFLRRLLLIVVNLWVFFCWFVLLFRAFRTCMESFTNPKSYCFTRLFRLLFGMSRGLVDHLESLWFFRASWRLNVFRCLCRLFLQFPTLVLLIPVRLPRLCAEADNGQLRDDFCLLLFNGLW